MKEQFTKHKNEKSSPAIGHCLRHGRQGFTLIEIILVMAIIGVLAVVSLKAMAKFRNQGILDSTVQGIVAVLREAQSLTLASKEDSSYGVQLEETRIVLFQGTTFDEDDPDNVVSDLAPQILISEIDLDSGGFEIVFERLTGETDNFGTTTVEISRGNSDPRYIIVEKSGIINLR